MGTQIGSPRKRRFWIHYSPSCHQPGHTLHCSHLAAASGLLCDTQSIIMLSMNRECKLINIIGTDALRLQFHFPFKRSPKLGRYNGGTLQSTASTRCICIAKWRRQLCGSLKRSWFFPAHVGVQPQPTQRNTLSISWGFSRDRMSSYRGWERCLLPGLATCPQPAFGSEHMESAAASSPPARSPHSIV